MAPKSNAVKKKAAKAKKETAVFALDKNTEAPAPVSGIPTPKSTKVLAKKDTLVEATKKFKDNFGVGERSLLPKTGEQTLLDAISEKVREVRVTREGFTSSFYKNLKAAHCYGFDLQFLFSKEYKKYEQASSIQPLLTKSQSLSDHEMDVLTALVAGLGSQSKRVVCAFTKQVFESLDRESFASYWNYLVSTGSLAAIVVAVDTHICSATPLGNVDMAKSILSDSAVNGPFRFVIVHSGIDYDAFMSDLGASVIPPSRVEIYKGIHFCCMLFSEVLLLSDSLRAEEDFNADVVGFVATCSEFPSSLVISNYIEKCISTYKSLNGVVQFYKKEHHYELKGSGAHPSLRERKIHHKVTLFMRYKLRKHLKKTIVEDSVRAIERMYEGSAERDSEITGFGSKNEEPLSGVVPAMVLASSTFRTQCATALKDCTTFDAYVGQAQKLLQSSDPAANCEVDILMWSLEVDYGKRLYDVVTLRLINSPEIDIQKALNDYPSSAVQFLGLVGKHRQTVDAVKSLTGISSPQGVPYLLRADNMDTYARAVRKGLIHRKFGVSQKQLNKQVLTFSAQPVTTPNYDEILNDYASFAWALDETGKYMVADLGIEAKKRKMAMALAAKSEVDKKKKAAKAACHGVDALADALEAFVASGDSESEEEKDCDEQDMPDPIMDAEMPQANLQDE